jgi:hypothetical protein
MASRPVAATGDGDGLIRRQQLDEPCAHEVVVIRDQHACHRTVLQ